MRQDCHEFGASWTVTYFARDPFDSEFMLGCNGPEFVLPTTCIRRSRTEQQLHGQLVLRRTKDPRRSIVSWSLKKPCGPVLQIHLVANIQSADCGPLGCTGGRFRSFD